jgi:hypothetical protein
LPDDIFNKIVQRLTEFKVAREKNGEKFFSNEYVLFHSFETETGTRRVAGEMDLFSINQKGEITIYDFKSSSYAFNNAGFSMNNSMFNISRKKQFEIQLSNYKNLLKNQYNFPVKCIAIIPLHVKDDGSKEKGIIPTKITSASVGTKNGIAMNLSFDSNVVVPNKSIDLKSDNLIKPDIITDNNDTKQTEQTKQKDENIIDTSEDAVMSKEKENKKNAEEIKAEVEEIKNKNIEERNIPSQIEEAL